MQERNSIGLRECAERGDEDFDGVGRRLKRWTLSPAGASFASRVGNSVHEEDQRVSSFELELTNAQRRDE